MTDSLHRELWTSWASMLRVYSAAHGLTSPRHAVVEVGAEEIFLRVNARWVRFSHQQQTSSEGTASEFALGDDGTVTLDGITAEMDMSAERVAREIFSI